MGKIYSADEMAVLEVFESFAVPSFTSAGMDPHGLHGPDHWTAVSRFAQGMLSASGINPLIGTFFGILHDCCRENDDHDPDHGPRAAEFAREIRSRIPLDNNEFGVLVRAIEIHNGADPIRPVYGWEDTAIACLLDADRLDISRCCGEVDTDFLSQIYIKSLVNSRESVSIGSEGYVIRFGVSGDYGETSRPNWAMTGVPDHFDGSSRNRVLVYKDGFFKNHDPRSTFGVSFLRKI